jgi:thiol:disulfide interchange protein DsbA
MNSMLARCWPLLLAGFFAAATAQADAVQGRDYRLLAPAQTGTHPGKVEVIEFFSYGCPHCAHFHPSVTKWASALPKDAVFVRIPVSFGRREWGQLVRAYYALEATGQLARFDSALFEAIHEQHKPLFDEARLAAWISEQGGDAAKFREAFNSSEVSQRAQRADQLSRDYRVSGVPQLAVAGKYVVLGQTYEDMLRIATELVTKSQPEAAAQTH